MKFTIAGIGEILWDIYGTEKYIGGVPANTAIHAHNLGHKGIIISRIGSDPFGKELINTLNIRGITTRYIQQDSAFRTGTVQIKLQPDMKPEYLCSRISAFDHLEFHDSLKTLSADAVIFGTLAQRNKTSRETILEFIASQKEAVIIYDAYFKGLRKNQKEIIENSLRSADILKVNKKEFLKLKKLIAAEKTDNKEFLHHLFEHFRLNLICVTLDKWGCYIFTKNETVYSPGVNVAPADTVGAGDAFTASLIIEYLKNKPLDTIAERANYVGAYTAGHKGAAPVYSQKEISGFIQLNNIRNNRTFYNFFT